MKPRIKLPLLAWAVRNAFRHPMDWALTVLGLGSLVALIGTALLLSQAVSCTTAAVLSTAPDVVVRRAAAVGFAALPVREALAAAASVPGVVRAVPRVWGTVSLGSKPVTVHSLDLPRGESPSSPCGPPVPPDAGQVLLGPGLAEAEAPAVVELHGWESATFSVAGQLGPETGVLFNDGVILHPRDARRLLGFTEDQATDLAVYVFHEAEAQAILPDLAGAFPWPVTVTTRKQAQGAYAAAYARRGSMTVVAGIPALLGLALLTAATVRRQMGKRSELGLLKALGWTTGDIVHQQMLQALVVGLPATAGGAVLAYALVFWPGVEWPGRFLMGWESRPPSLYLTPEGAGVVLVELLALVFLPYAAAVLWPALQGATADPQDLIENE